MLMVTACSDSDAHPKSSRKGTACSQTARNTPSGSRSQDSDAWLSTADRPSAQMPFAPPETNVPSGVGKIAAADSFDQGRIVASSPGSGSDVQLWPPSKEM